MALPPERPGFPAQAELAAQRLGLAKAVASGVWRTDPEPVEELIGGVRCLRFRSRHQPRGTVLHFHGGGFRLGCPEQVGPFAAALAERCAVDVICPAYRLAPEHPFPAGLMDARAVLSGLLASGAATLVISGDSAGGGLATGLIALWGDASPRPAGLTLLSPWLDLAETQASFAANAASDPLFSALSAMAAAALYLQGIPAQHPLASPLRGPVASFPPTLINVGSGEVLLDDARQMHKRLREAGVAVQFHEVAGMDHVAVTRDRALPGAAESFAVLATFIDKVLA